MAFSSSPRFDDTAPTGGALGFVAARRRRRQAMQLAPDLRCERLVEPVLGVEGVPDGTLAWTLRFANLGGRATQARVLLLVGDAVVRREAGDGGTIDAGGVWTLALEDIEAQAGRPPLGYLLARAADGRWVATTVDGRTATFRAEPDELGVVQTLGLRMALFATAGHRPPLGARR